jgi:methionyl-tRNA formyltransferase
MIKRFKVGFFGDKEWAHIALKKMIKDKTLELKFICGRFFPQDNKLQEIAKKNKINFYNPENIHKKKFLKILKKSGAEIFVSMSYDQIFKKEIIEMVNKKIINCHAGKLPFYRGRNILNWAIINGEKEFGITTHFVNEKIDQGDIIIQKTFKIKKKDDLNSVLKVATKQCGILIYKTLKQVQNNNYKVIKQRKISKNFSYFPKRKKGDEIIDFNKNSFEINNFVRGLVKPGPYARIRLKNNEIFVKKVNITKKINYKKFYPGRIVKMNKKKFYINTKDNKAIIVEKWFSKKKINLKLGLELR